MNNYFTSQYWINHFKANALEKRIDWNITPRLTAEEIAVILPSIQAWQLAETSEGEQLIRAATRHASKIGDPVYVDAVKLFIKEEQKHGENLGMYLDAIGVKRIKKSWDDSMFREVRHLNTSMEIWTLTVLVVESTAQIFYQALKDATKCALLKQICTDILIDEAYHITFQTERLAIVFNDKTEFSRWWRVAAYKYFFIATSSLVWFAHRRLFKAGGNTFTTYRKKMELKYVKTIKTVTGNVAPMWI
jgi:6-pyruvoyl-tetrahydropterin synthase